MTIKIGQIRWELDYSEPTRGYDLYPLTAFVASENDSTGWTLYLAVSTEFETARLEAVEIVDGFSGRGFSSDSTRDWPMLDDLFGGRDKWQRFCNDYATNAIREYRSESQSLND